MKDILKNFKRAIKRLNFTKKPNKKKLQRNLELFSLYLAFIPQQFENP